MAAFFRALWVSAHSTGLGGHFPASAATHFLMSLVTSSQAIYQVHTVPDVAWDHTALVKSLLVPGNSSDSGTSRQWYLKATLVPSLRRPACHSACGVSVPLASEQQPLELPHSYWALCVHN